MRALRHPELQGVLETVCADLTQDTAALPHADLVVANLLVEYIGYECFQKVIGRIRPQYVSCIIQINTDTSFVSDSPYIQAFERLDEVHHQMEEAGLTAAMDKIGYQKAAEAERDLPNGKKLVRLDFSRRIL